MAAKVIANMYLSKAIGKNPFSAVFYEFNGFMHDGIVCSGKCMRHINNVLLTIQNPNLHGGLTCGQFS